MRTPSQRPTASFRRPPAPVPPCRSVRRSFRPCPSPRNRRGAADMAAFYPLRPDLQRVLLVAISASSLDEPVADAPVMTALVVDLEDADGARATRGREMRPTARLAIETHDLYDADQAVRRR